MTKRESFIIIICLIGLIGLFIFFVPDKSDDDDIVTNQNQIDNSTGTDTLDESEVEETEPHPVSLLALMQKEFEEWMTAAEKDITFYVYEDEPHEFINAWPQVMERTVDFFDEWIK